MATERAAAVTPASDGPQWHAADSLRAVPPFDFNHALAVLGSFPATRHEQTTTTRELTKAFLVDGRIVVARISNTCATDVPELALALHAAIPMTDELRAAIADRVRFYLSLDDELEPFYAIGLADPAFAPVIEALYGYHQVKFPTPFESACWAVLSQRTALSVARRHKRAMTEAFGRRLGLEGQTLTTFPDARTIANMPPAELDDVVRNERQTRYLNAVAHAFAGADEAFLRSGPVDEVEEWLRKIEGIGSWSASLILIRGLGRMEVAPREPKLPPAAARCYGIRSPNELTEIAQRYGPWQGYWAHYLRVADVLAVVPER